MNQMEIFSNQEFGSIRTFEQDGKVLFCGKDIAKALGYQRTADAITAHCKGVCVLPTPSNGGIQRMKFIPEGDVYRLIVHSKLPSAERFERWVFDEVLPSIRKHGACSIVPIAAARCMSTAPTTASAFLNIPVPNTAKSQLESSARPSTVSMKMWYCPLSLKC